MATTATREGNIIYCSGAGTASFPENICIEAIKYIGAATSSAALTDYASSKALWEEASSSNVFNEVCLRTKNGITVTLTGTAAVYLYLK